MNGTVPEEAEGSRGRGPSDGETDLRPGRDRGSLSSEPTGKGQVLLNICVGWEKETGGVSNLWPPFHLI